MKKKLILKKKVNWYINPFSYFKEISSPIYAVSIIIYLIIINEKWYYKLFIVLLAYAFWSLLETLERIRRNVTYEEV